MTQKQPKPEEIVVFSILKASQCSECGIQLEPGAWLKTEGDKALCLSCADLDLLVYLPSGNTALTRRTSKYTTLKAVLVRFSRSRQRYERQGILVEEAALQKAEADCLADAEVRERQRLRSAEKRTQQDKKYIQEFAQQISRQYPACSVAEAETIATHACQKYSGRVGRSAAAKDFDPAVIELAVVAHIRHVHTRYDEMLGNGWDRQEAREAIASDAQAVLSQWSTPFS
jgi:hypothetical protein